MRVAGIVRVLFEGDSDRLGESKSFKLSAWDRGYPGFVCLYLNVPHSAVRVWVQSLQ